MRFAYMVATPEVKGPRVTAWRGDLDDAFAAVAHAGFAGVELMVRDPFQLDASSLQSLSDRHGLIIPTICTGEVYGEDGISFADPDPAIRAEAVKRIVRLAELGAALNAHITVGRMRGRYTDGIPAGQTLAWISEGLRAGAAVSPAVRILLEPINRQVTNCLLTTAEGLSFVEQLGIPNVNLMLDTMHMHAEGEELPTAFTMAAAQCYHVHVGQANRLAPGTSDEDLSPIFAALRQMRYAGWVGVEVWQEPDQETALRRSAEALRPFIDTEGGAVK